MHAIQARHIGHIDLYDYFINIRLKRTIRENGLRREKQKRIRRHHGRAEAKSEDAKAMDPLGYNALRSRVHRCDNRKQPSVAQLS